MSDEIYTLFDTYIQKREELHNYITKIVVDLPIDSTNEVLFYESFEYGLQNYRNEPLYAAVIANRKYGIVVATAVSKPWLIDPTLSNAGKGLYFGVGLTLYKYAKDGSDLEIPYIAGKTLTIAGLLELADRIMWHLDKLFAGIDAFYPGFADLAKSVNLAYLLKEFRELVYSNIIEVSLDDDTILIIDSTNVGGFAIETSGKIIEWHEKEFNDYNEKYNIERVIREILNERISRIEKLIDQWDEIFMLFKLAGVI